MPPTHSGNWSDHDGPATDVGHPPGGATHSGWSHGRGPDHRRARGLRSHRRLGPTQPSSTPRHRPAPSRPARVELVTVSASGTWSWNVGTAAGDVNAPAGSPASQCGGHYGVGWGMVWNDPESTPATPSPTRTSPRWASARTLAVNGNKTDDEAVEYADSSLPCGTFNAGDTVTLSDNGPATTPTPVPASVPCPRICVVTYLLKSAPGKYPRQYKVDKNKKQLVHAAAKAKASVHRLCRRAPNCFDPLVRSWPRRSSSPRRPTPRWGRPSPTRPLTGTGPGRHHGPDPPGHHCGEQRRRAPSPSTSTGPVTPGAPRHRSSPRAGDHGERGTGPTGPSSFTPTQGPGTYRWIATVPR
jgi:hypothetical protein